MEQVGVRVGGMTWARKKACKSKFVNCQNIVIHCIFVQLLLVFKVMFTSKILKPSKHEENQNPGKVQHNHWNSSHYLSAIFDQKQYIFDHQQLISIIHFAEMIKLKVELQQIKPTKLHGKRKPLWVGCDWSENSMRQVTVQAVWNR